MKGKSLSRGTTPSASIWKRFAYCTPSNHMWHGIHFHNLHAFRVPKRLDLATIHFRWSIVNLLYTYPRRSFASTCCYLACQDPSQDRKYLDCHDMDETPLSDGILCEYIHSAMLMWATKSAGIDAYNFLNADMG
jgi:hypothetical protein